MARFKLVKDKVNGGSYLIKVEEQLSTIKNVENYDHMMDDIERDLIDYVIGLWHQRRIQAYIKRKSDGVTKWPS